MSTRSYFCQVDAKSATVGDRKADALEVGDELDNDRHLYVCTLGIYGRGPSVWLNREQVTDLRDRLTKILGDGPTQPPALPLWTDER